MTTKKKRVSVHPTKQTRLDQGSLVVASGLDNLLFNWISPLVRCLVRLRLFSCAKSKSAALWRAGDDMPVGRCKNHRGANYEFQCLSPFCRLAYIAPAPRLDTDSRSQHTEAIPCRASNDYLMQTTRATSVTLAVYSYVC